MSLRNELKLQPLCRMAKIDPRIILTVLFLTVFIKMNAQETIVLTGLVQSDSVQLQDIHVLNVSSRQGTVTNRYGEFRIPVSAQDTLFFSGLQFHTLGIVIVREVLEKKIIRIELIPKIEELTEIELKGHDLDGLFYIDTKRLKDSLPLVAEEAVDFSKQGYNDPSSSNYIIPEANLINLISLIGKNRRKEQSRNENLVQLKRQAPDNMRKEFGEEVFTEQLGIPRDHIEPFIQFCQKKDIINLYVEGRLMEVIDILVKEKENYIRERISDQ